MMQAECQALEKGMQLERDGREFYLKAAERTSSQSGKQMFLSLADDERVHLQVLERQLHTLQQEGRCQLPEEAGEITSDWDQPLFPKDREVFEKTVDPTAGDLDALHFAIQAENQSFEFYRKAAGETEDPAARQMYKWLASVERGHFNQLMLNYESLVHSGHWAA